MDNKSPEHWTLDKRVPVGIILAIFIQTFIIGSYLGRLDSRVTSIEDSRFTQADGARIETQVENNEKNIDRLEQRTIRSLDEIKVTLEEIRRAVNKQYEEGK